MSRLSPHREILDNGAVFLWSRSEGASTVSIRGTFPAGAARETPEQAGLAGFAARLLRRGSTQRGAQEIAAAIEDLGASFNVWGSSEEAGFSAKCLARDQGAVLDLLGEVLQFPEFAEREIEKTREEIHTQFRELEDSTRAQSDLCAQRMLYPADHPYGRPALGRAETVDRFGPADFRAFHAAYYGADELRIAVAGAVDPDVVRGCTGSWFSGRTAAPPMPDFSVTPSGKPQRAAVSMPHKSQVDLVITGPAVPRRHPDYYALSMVNLILGSLGLMGRLGEEVREKHGMAYYVYSQVNSRIWAGEWTSHAGVAPANVDRTIRAIRGEVERIREELVTETEFADACDYLIGSLPLRMETSDGVAGYLLNAEYYGLGLDYLDRYPGYIRAETRESLREAARTHLDPARFSIAAAGPVDASGELGGGQ
jgi:zinc protease